jgi:hypothetical protein
MHVEVSDEPGMISMVIVFIDGIAEMTAIPHRMLNRSQMIDYENTVRVLHSDSSYTLIHSSKPFSISRECCHIQASQHKVGETGTID